MTKEGRKMLGKKRQNKTKGQKRRMRQKGTKNARKKEKTLSKNKRNQWKQEKKKKQEKEWDGLLQRMTRDRCPCHCDHRTNNYQWKMRQKEVNQEEQNIFKERSTRFFQQKLKKGIFLKKNGVWKFVLFLKSKKIRIQRRAFFFLTGSLTTLSVYCILQNFHSFWHPKLGELVVASHTAMYWICGTTTVFCTPFWAALCAK